MLPIHVINLASRPDRLAAIADGLTAQGLAWQRVEAIDATQEDPQDLRLRFGSDPIAARLFPATMGDMACSLTHQLLWRTIAQSRAEAAIVLEDDARLSEDFARIAACDLAGIMRRNGMGVLKLEFWPGPQASRRQPLAQDLGPICGHIKLYRMRSTFLGTAAYVMTADAARRLGDGFSHLDVPVDHFLFGRSAGKAFDAIRPGFVNPAPVMHDVDTFGSDIRDQRSDPPRNLPLARRWRDYRMRRTQEREVRSGRAEPVVMQFAGGDVKPDTVGGRCLSASISQTGDDGSNRGRLKND